MVLLYVPEVVVGKLANGTQTGAFEPGAVQQ